MLNIIKIVSSVAGKAKYAILTQNPTSLPSNKRNQAHCLNYPCHTGLVNQDSAPFLKEQINWSARETGVVILISTTSQLTMCNDSNSTNLVPTNTP